MSSHPAEEISFDSQGVASPRPSTRQPQQNATAEHTQGQEAVFLQMVVMVIGVSKIYPKRGPVFWVPRSYLQL